MTEAILQYIWQTQQFENRNLRTTRNDSLFIIHPGYQNMDAGPDFLHAKVRINDTLWAGHIELHVRSSEWIAHQHSSDRAYDNVILHVVFTHDREIRLHAHDEPLSTLELKPLISTKLLHLYQQFHRYKKDFACQEMFEKVDHSIVALTCQRMAVERLEAKALQVRDLWLSLDKDWLHTMYCLVGRYLAGPVNGHQMQILIGRLKPKWLLRTKDDLVHLEALLLGTAGLLKEPKDDYSHHLLAEFSLARKKYNLKPMEEHLWKYSRMRPDNFIDLRIAQFAFWLHANDSIWNKVLTCSSKNELKQIFRITLRHYWSSHYRLGTPTGRKSKRLGKTTVERIIINALAPLLFLYGREHQNEIFQERAMQWLMDIAPEKNRITRLWDLLNVRSENSFESQGLIHWRQNYCEKRACAKCPVCHAILRESSELDKKALSD